MVGSVKTSISNTSLKNTCPHCQISFDNPSEIIFYLLFNMYVSTLIRKKNCIVSLFFILVCKEKMLYTYSLFSLVIL